MTSASTKRRHQRNAAPYSDAPLPWNHRAEKEIQRLRAAMVHAMDDCKWIASRYGLRGDVKATAFRAQKTLQTALEKK